MSFHDDRLSELETILATADDGERVRAVRELARMSAPGAKALLERARDDESAAVRYLACRALEDFGRKGTDGASAASGRSKAIGPSSSGRSVGGDSQVRSGSLALDERDVIPVTPPPAVSGESTAGIEDGDGASPGGFSEDFMALVAGPTVKVAPEEKKRRSTRRVIPPGLGSEAGSTEDGPSRSPASPVPGAGRGVAGARDVVTVAAEAPSSAGACGTVREPVGPLPHGGPGAVRSAPKGAEPCSPSTAAATEPDGTIAGREELPALLAAARAFLEPATRLLAARLCDSDQAVRSSAARALGILGVRGVGRKLLDLIKAGDLDDGMIEALGRIGDKEAAAYLVRLYSGARAAHLRHRIVTALYEMHEPGVTPFLSKVLEEAEPAVKAALVRKIGNCGDARFSRILVDLLERGEEFLAIDLIRALSAVAGHDSGVAKALSNRLAVESRPRLLSALVNALPRDASCVDRLSPLLRHADARVRANTVEALDRAVKDGPQKTELLGPLLRDGDNRVRANAALALAGAGVAAGAATLKAMVTSADKWHRASAAFALGRLAVAGVVPLLVMLLQDSDNDVRLNAARALKDLGDARAVGALARALADTNTWVRVNVVEALGTIGNGAAFDLLARHVTTERNGQVLAKAVESLAFAAQDPAVARMVIKRFLGHRNGAIRLAAVRSLEYVITPQHLSLLAPCLRDDDHAVRSAAVCSIFKLGETKIVEPLCLMLGEGTARSAVSAADILYDLGSMLERLDEQVNAGYLLLALRRHPAYGKVGIG